MSKLELTFDQVDAHLEYEAETGKLFWKRKVARKIVLGTEAGTVKKCHGGKFYYYVTVDKKCVPAARVAWLLYYGNWPVSKLRFKDGDTMNLRINNLEEMNSLSGSYSANGDFDRKRYMIEHREAFPVFWKDSHLRSKFGIDMNAYIAMQVEQRGLCAICEQPETATRNGKVKALAVDHCHETGKVRGLLCSDCNQAIGKLKENRDTLLSAIRYLDKHADSGVNVVEINSGKETA